MVVDVHAHAIPPEVVSFLKREGPELGLEVRRLSDRVWFQHREGYGYPVGPDFTSVDFILERMDRTRVHHRVLSIPPTLFFYSSPPSLTARVCRVINDALVAFARNGRGRLWAMIAVPLQDPDRAAEEVVRLAADSVVKGVEVGTNVEERPLDDPALEPFFRACEQARLPVFLHPYYVGPKPRLEPYYLTNTLGNPIDTTIAISRLVHGGVLERHPGLRVILAHGGGFFPYQRGRLEHAFVVRSEPKAVCDRPPSAFTSQIYYDTVLHFPAALRYLVETVGAKHVLMGSDYPFDMGVEQPVAFVEGANLTPTDQKLVLGGAAAELFGLGTGGGGRSDEVAVPS